MCVIVREEEKLAAWKIVLSALHIHRSDGGAVGAGECCWRRTLRADVADAIEVQSDGPLCQVHAGRDGLRKRSVPSQVHCPGSEEGSPGPEPQHDQEPLPPSRLSRDVATPRNAHS